MRKRKGVTKPTTPIEDDLALLARTVADHEKRLQALKEQLKALRIANAAKLAPPKIQLVENPESDLTKAKVITILVPMQ